MSAEAAGPAAAAAAAAAAAYAGAVWAWAACHLVWQGALAAVAYRLWRVATPDATPAARYHAALAALAALPAAALLGIVATHGALAADARVTALGAAPRSAAPAMPALASAYDAVFDARAWGALVWALGAALGAGRLLVAWRRLRAVRRDAHPAPPALGRRVAALARAAGLPSAPRVLVSAAGAGPLVAAGRPAVLVLPDAAACALRDDEWDAVVLHELAHVRRRDYAVHWGVQLLAAACWFHPGVWWLARAAADAREECCDADAVRVSRRPLALARALVRLEESRQASQWSAPWRAAGVAAADGALAARVRRLLAGAVPTRPSQAPPPHDASHAARRGARHAARRAAAAVLAAALAAALLGSPLAASSAATASQRLPVAAARAGVVPARQVRIDAADPAGAFTVRLTNGRVSGATMNGRDVRPALLRVRDGELTVRGDGGAVLLAAQVDPRGGLRWTARPAAGPRRSASAPAQSARVASW